MLGKPVPVGLHAAWVIVPPILVLGFLALVAMFIAGWLRQDAGDLVAYGSGVAALLFTVTGVLATFLWIGGWWTEESDRRDAPRSGVARSGPRSLRDILDDLEAQDDASGP